MLLSAEGKLKTNPVCRHGEAGRQGKPSAWVGQRIENKELAGGRRMGQYDSQCSMAETKREARRQPPPCIAEDGNSQGNNLQLSTTQLLASGAYLTQLFPINFGSVPYGKLLLGTLVCFVLYVP